MTLSEFSNFVIMTVIGTFIGKILNYSTVIKFN